MDLLIVEDDPIIRDGMSEYLSEWGYHVRYQGCSFGYSASIYEWIRCFKRNKKRK